jgi:hypothetical protein
MERTYYWNSELLVGEAAYRSRLDQAFAQIADNEHRIDSIAWDNCHKIYLALTTKQTEELADLGYDVVRSVSGGTFVSIVKDWYARSCGLVFVTGLTDDGDWIDFIPQIYVDN